jgi:hypothetical protein
MRKLALIIDSIYRARAMRAAMAMAPRPLRPAALFSPTPEGAGVLVALPAASDLVVGVSMTGGTAVVLLSTTGGTVVASAAVVSTAVVSTATALVVTTTLVEVSTLVVSALEDSSEPLPAAGLSQSFSVAGRTSSKASQYVIVYQVWRVWNLLMATSEPHLVITQEVAALRTSSKFLQTQVRSVLSHLVLLAIASSRQGIAHLGTSPRD